MKNPELISIIVQITTSVIAVIIATLSFVWTTKSQRDANKPYIVAYLQKLDINNTSFTYLIIKNFGKTGARIKKVSSKPEIKSGSLGFENNPFSNFTDQIIAPDQTYAAAISIKGTPYELQTKKFELTVKYLDNRSKLQIQLFVLDEAPLKDIKHFNVAPTEGGSVAQAIYKTAGEELVSRL